MVWIENVIKSRVWDNGCFDDRVIRLEWGVGRVVEVWVSLDYDYVERGGCLCKKGGCCGKYVIWVDKGE